MGVILGLTRLLAGFGSRQILTATCNWRTTGRRNSPRVSVVLFGMGSLRGRLPPRLYADVNIWGIVL